MTENGAIIAKFGLHEIVSIRINGTQGTIDEIELWSGILVYKINNV